MKKTFAALALATSIGAAGATGAIAQDMDMGFNMLTGAVYLALDRQGFDTSNIQNLTLSEIAQIKVLLEGDDMGNASRQQIQKILDK